MSDTTPTTSAPTDREPTTPDLLVRAARDQLTQIDDLIGRNQKIRDDAAAEIRKLRAEKAGYERIVRAATPRTVTRKPKQTTPEAAK